MGGLHPRRDGLRQILASPSSVTTRYPWRLHPHLRHQTARHQLTTGGKTTVSIQVCCEKTVIQTSKLMAPQQNQNLILLLSSCLINSSRSTMKTCFHCSRLIGILYYLCGAWEASIYIMASPADNGCSPGSCCRSTCRWCCLLRSMCTHPTISRSLLAVTSATRRSTTRATSLSASTTSTTACRAAS